MDFFYRKKPWYAGQFVRKVLPKFNVSENGVLFFTTLLNSLKKNLLNVLVRDVDKTFLNNVIKVPITGDDEIDFEFIDSFVAEMEAQRVAELEAYLQVTGLKDYELTEEEESVLYTKVDFKEFKIGELFEKLKVNNLKYKTSDLPSTPTKDYNLPALTAGIQNQGLNNYVPQHGATILNRVISISANGANTGATFYQSKKFTVLQDAYAINWKDKKQNLSDNLYLYMTGVISKAIYGNYEWTNKAGWERIKSNIIHIPTFKNRIDFDYMDTLISAIKKLVIKDAVKYADNKISATRKVINK